MKNRRLLAGIIAGIALVVALPIAWYLISPLFITRHVDEAFPIVEAADAVAATAPSPDAMSSPMADAMMEASMAPSPAGEPMSEASMAPMAEPMADPTAMPSEAPMAEPMSDPTAAPSMEAMVEPTAVPAPAPTEAPTEPQLLLTGSFHDVEHEGSGTASIYQLPNGKRILRLENFAVLNGPDLYVWLAKAPDANDARTILDGGYFEVGRLKGNTGNQNYDLPDDLDISSFHSVTIWCRRFSVNFATAPLT